MPSHLERARALLERRTHKVIAIDIECFERDQSYMTELGWSVFDPATGELTSHHDIIKENMRKRNGRYVPDNRDHFLFGRSRLLRGDLVLDEFEAMLDRLTPCIVVGHDIKSDIRLLREQDVELPDDVVLFDTKKLYCCYSDNPQNGRKLSVVLDRLGIPYNRLHNAGNDARFTMEAFLKMAAPEMTVIPTEVHSPSNDSGWAMTETTDPDPWN
ncbi:hypothetical protein IWQ61_001217 [Dispira simplex]|nr:hypothetical protein IWQ61_001217 [Dispira simplex]